MLKRVVFLLKKEDALNRTEKLLDELKARGIEITIEDIHDRKYPDEETFSGNTLYITDHAACQIRLRMRNLPVLIYLHEENREEHFLQSEYAIEQIEEVEYESLELAYLRLTGQPWTVYTTNRCIIRETTTNDVDDFYEIYKDSSITDYMEDLFADKDEEIAYIEDYIRNVYQFYGYGMWTVLLKESGKVIGRAGISWREGFDIPELGFVIGVPWQRQGYAYEVCQAILEYGREELGFTRFQALVMEGNDKSERLCRKLGFVYLEDIVLEGHVYKRMVYESSSGDF